MRCSILRAVGEHAFMQALSPAGSASWGGVLRWCTGYIPYPVLTLLCTCLVITLLELGLGLLKYVYGLVRLLLIYEVLPFPQQGRGLIQGGEHYLDLGLGLGDSLQTFRIMRQLKMGLQKARTIKNKEVSS